MNDNEVSRPNDFDGLVDSIEAVHRQASTRANRAINISLTIRNWMIGCHIKEYELDGSDRAEYGDRLFERVSERLAKRGVSNINPRELRRYRDFYIAYDRIRGALTPELRKSLPGNDLEIRGTVSPEFADDLVQKLSFSHLAELMKCDSAEKRAFYEDQCIRGTWSVRELKRQIASLLYERSELSIDKQKLAEQTSEGAETDSPRLTIRDPYVFEFLGLRAAEVMGESDLENELLDKLQSLLLEMGEGFCFEARQKRILIGEEYYFVDLVFYHRILKCHVLVDLKLEAFSHENIGQLNTYVSWYDKNVRVDGDNPPVGILLCTERDHALVEYATAAMTSDLFVSKYQLELPSKELLQKEIEAERKRLEGEA
ncbi:PDDEXK nuclease domain-containing protein [Rosistilla oblonga]|uniref:PDDEXK nuclease domain-containing protein n=1 Tax=Rosistilla oblonga TaxID=2527990 RepID=UPI003A97FDF3